MKKNKRKVLIVDDEKNVLSSMQRALKCDDYDIITLSSPGDVIEIIYKNTDIDLIISDYNMPHMNGVEMLTEVANLFPHTKRFIVSAYQDFNIIVDALNDGVAHRFFSKPWDIDDLKLKINDALDERIMLKNPAKAKEITRYQQHARWFDFLDQLDLAINYGTAPVAVVVISLKNVQSLYLTCGMRKYQDVIENLFDRIKEFYENKYLVRILNESTFGVMIPLDEQNNEDFIIRQLTQLYEYLEQPLHIGNAEIKTVVHCGIAIYPEHGNSAEYLTRNAQEAMYNSLSKDRKIGVYKPKHLGDSSSSYR